MRVDVVEVLVVDVPAVPEVQHRAVDRLEIVGDVAVGGHHDGAVDHRQDGHRPQHRPQYGRGARRGGAGSEMWPAPSRADRHGWSQLPSRAHRTRYRGREGSGGTVGVGGWQVAAVEVADQRGNRARRVDAGAVADALPHHPLAGRGGVDDGGGGGRDALGPDDRVVLHAHAEAR